MGTAVKIAITNDLLIKVINHDSLFIILLRSNYLQSFARLLTHISLTLLSLSVLWLDDFQPRLATCVPPADRVFVILKLRSPAATFDVVSPDHIDSYTSILAYGFAIPIRYKSIFPRSFGSYFRIAPYLNSTIMYGILTINLELAIIHLVYLNCFGRHDIIVVSLLTNYLSQK